MFRALIIRQKEEALPLARHLKQRGIQPFICSLFTPRFFPLSSLELPQGLIITSKNALRALKDRQDLRGLPVYAVGDQTAEFARQMGFSKVLSAGGGEHELCTLIRSRVSPSQGKLWYLSGEVIKGNILESLRQEGFDVERHILYALEAKTSLPFSLRHALSERALTHVLFFSAQTTACFIQLLKKSNLETAAAHMTALCISEDVVQKAAALMWKKIWVSPHPTTQAMMGCFHEKL